MKRYLNRFVKTVKCLTLSVLLLLSLSINVFASSGGGTINTSTNTQYYYTNSSFFIPKAIQTASDIPVGSQLYLAVSQGFDAVDVSAAPYVQIDFAYTFSAAHGQKKPSSLPFILRFSSPVNYVGTSIQVAKSELNPVVLLNSELTSAAASSSICSFVVDAQAFQSWLVPTGATTKGLYLWYEVADFVYSDLSSSNYLFLVSVKQTYTTDIVVDADLEFKLNEISSQLNRIDSTLGSIDDGINGNYVDQNDVDNIENTVGDHEAAEAEVQDALNSIIDTVYEDSNGNAISVSFDPGFLDNLANVFSFDLNGFAVAQSAQVFRKTLGGYIGLFGSYIFFPLVLGLLGALLGRPHGA